MGDASQEDKAQVPRNKEHCSQNEHGCLVDEPERTAGLWSRRWCLSLHPHDGSLRGSERGYVKDLFRRRTPSWGIGACPARGLLKHAPGLQLRVFRCHPIPVSRRVRPGPEKLR